MYELLARAPRKVMIVIAQALMVITAFVLALLLQNNGNFAEISASFSVAIILPLVTIKLCSFGLMRLFTGWWRFVSVPDLIALVKANVTGSLLFALYCNYAQVNSGFTWSLLVLDGMLCFLLLSGSRVTVRMLHEYLDSPCNTADIKSVIVIGAGAVGQSIVREARQNRHLKVRIAGFVDQDANRQKQWFQGVQVLSNIDRLGEQLRSHKIHQVILADHSLSSREMRQIVGTCRKYGVKSKILPKVSELLDDNISLQNVRDIKFDDLLGRPAVSLEIDEIRQYLGGKRVLVSGAAGSIGREISRQVAEFGAATVILLDNAETPLFHVERELSTTFADTDFITSLSDIRNPSRVADVFQSFAPQVVFHAAAYKHVPMSEQNPVAAIENNVLGTRNLAEAACLNRVDHFVMISTDKAVNPTNIMGASKRAAEIYVQSMAGMCHTSFVTVRFGNVLGSNGSVVPIFQEQIRSGGPVTVTDPNATRFFMTIPEAVQLVLQAGSMGEGGEIFILNMGEQIRILHLAEELIRLSGLAPYRDIGIVFTGLRPGEKLHEELLLDCENILPTRHAKISVAKAIGHDSTALALQLNRLEQACSVMDRNTVLKVLCEIVPEYRCETFVCETMNLGMPSALLHLDTPLACGLAGNA